MKLRFTPLLLTLTLTGCAGWLPPSVTFTQTPLKAIDDAEVRDLSAEALLWHGENRDLLYSFDGESQGVQPRGVRRHEGGPEANGGTEGSLFCLSTASQAPCDNFGLTNKEIFNIRGLGGLTGYTPEYNPAPAQTLAILENHLLAHYAEVRHQPEALLAFLEQYRAVGEHPLLARDVARAYNQLGDRSAKAAAEGYLVNRRLVKLQSGELKAGGDRQRRQTTLLDSNAANVRSYHQTLTVALNQDAGVPVQFNRYRLKIKSTFQLNYTNRKPQTLEQENEVLLTPANHYREKITVRLDDVATAGWVKPVGLGLLANLAAGAAEAFGGAKGQEDAKEMRKLKDGYPFKLEHITPEHEILSLEVAP